RKKTRRGDRDRVKGLARKRQRCQPARKQRTREGCRESFPRQHALTESKMHHATVPIELAQPKRSTQRRLRKMSQDLLPTTFSFTVQARILCVGMALVYRVAITMEATTTYATPTTSSSTQSGSTCHSWVIAMSQAKFRTFHANVTSILKEQAVQRYLMQTDGAWKPFEGFLRILMSIFHRYQHLVDFAFAIRADTQQMNEGKIALEQFMTDCWKSLEVILPMLAIEPQEELGREILKLYVLMREFLDFPESILQANCVYASAILSLEDVVEDHVPALAEHTCSICLEALLSVDMRELDPACAATTSDVVQVIDTTHSVRLPCAHLFHENCVMAWLRHNPTCPHCPPRMLLDFPVHDGFFPQIALSAEEVKDYKRLGKKRLRELLRIAEDSDCSSYKWTETKAKSGGMCLKARFLDLRESSNSSCASVLLKSSVQVTARPEEIIQALAKVKTKAYRKMMQFQHGNLFLDGRTLFRFPSSSLATNKPQYAYRAIKWCAFKGRGREADHKSLDFCFLEYAGKKKPTRGSDVLAFCLQESISREREVPTLENFGIARGRLSRTGIILSSSSTEGQVIVTSICQIDGDLPALVRNALEDVMSDMVSNVSRVKGLVERQRVSSLEFLEHWRWIPNSERKACAVCLKGFYFHRKHHCRACGEVVCSNCAPLRDLEEPIFDITRLRVCKTCVERGASIVEKKLANDSFAMSMLSSSDCDTESMAQGLRSPTAPNHDEGPFRMRPEPGRQQSFSPPPREEVFPTIDGRRKNSPVKASSEHMDVISDIVGRIRQVRETITLTISEADQERLSLGDEDAFNHLYQKVDHMREMDFNDVEALQLARRRSIDHHAERPSVNTDFDAVVRTALAAARATQEAGEAVLSSCASDVNREYDYDELSSLSPSRVSTRTGYTASSTHSCPFSSSNYERIMAAAAASAANSAVSPMDGGRLSSLDDSLHFAETAHGTSGEKTMVIRELEQKIVELTRSLELAQLKLHNMEGDEPEPERQVLDVVYEDVKQEQRTSSVDDESAKSDRSYDEKRRRLSESPETEVHSVNKSVEATTALVMQLRGVMNSSELTKPALPPKAPRKTSSASPNASFVSVDVTKPRPRSPLRLPEPQNASMLYADDNGCIVSPPPSVSSAKEAAEEVDDLAADHADLGGGYEDAEDTNNFGSTASSTASLMDGVTDIDSHTSSRGIFGTSAHTGFSSGLNTARYHELMSNLCIPDDISSDGESMLGFCDLRPRRESSVDLNQHFTSPGRRALPRRPPSFPSISRPSTLLQHRKGSMGGQAFTRDETDELRGLVEGLANRPRSASAPFHANQRPSSVVTNDGYSDAKQPSTVWSDEATGRRHTTPHHFEDSAIDVRNCLASLRCECTSRWERKRKLKSLYKVLGCMYKDGVKSKYRTLRHEDIRYDRVLTETPSVVRLLKMAGYVSLPQKLTMRRVDQEYIGIILNEIRRELQEHVD
ncbi:TPA: hypothetical protein N0F65_009576, partial [Lagenidium giganteum]